MNKNLRALGALIVGAMVALVALAPAQALTYRKTQYQVVHAISKVVTYADFTASDLTEGFPSGIPSGSRIVGFMANVATAFNGTPSISVGWTGSTSAIITTTTLAPATTGSKTGILFPVTSANVQPLVTLATYSALPTAGSMTLTVLYYPFTN